MRTISYNMLNQPYTKPTIITLTSLATFEIYILIISIVKFCNLSSLKCWILRIVEFFMLAFFNGFERLLFSFHIWNLFIANPDYRVRRTYISIHNLCLIIFLIIKPCHWFQWLRLRVSVKRPRRETRFQCVVLWVVVFVWDCNHEIEAW